MAGTTYRLQPTLGPGGPMAPGKPWKNPSVKITAGSAPSLQFCLKFLSYDSFISYDVYCHDGFILTRNPGGPSGPAGPGKPGRPGKPFK